MRVQPGSQPLVSFLSHGNEDTFELWDVFPSRKKSIEETGTHQELSIDDVKREQRSKEEKILIRKDAGEMGEEPTREEDESI